MNGTLAPDLGIGPDTWLFLCVLAVVVIFFKFNRLFSLRNLDLFLLFVLSPGFLRLVPKGSDDPLSAYAWLFAGSFLLMGRCLLDLGLSRRPLPEPNLTPPAMLALVIGLLALLLSETAQLPLDRGAQRNPAQSAGAGPRSDVAELTVEQALLETLPRDPALRIPLPTTLSRTPLQEVLSRVLAAAAHVSLAVCLALIGSRHFGRPSIGLSAAVCHLALPYTRIAVVDSGQLVAAALILWAVWRHRSPIAAGAFVAAATAWIPGCLGLLPIWASYYRGWGVGRFLGSASATLAICAAPAWMLPEAGDFAAALGARNLIKAGLWPGSDSDADSDAEGEDGAGGGGEVEVSGEGNGSGSGGIEGPGLTATPGPNSDSGMEGTPGAGAGAEAGAGVSGAGMVAGPGRGRGPNRPPASSFWNHVEPSYRLPVLVAYLALVALLTVLPARKDLGDLIAISAAVLIAGQFWYLDHGGTLVMLYLPLAILTIFRPTLKPRRAAIRASDGARGASNGSV